MIIPIRVASIGQVDLFANHLYYIEICLMSRMFSNGLGDRGSILGRVIRKTLKTILDAALLNTQHSKIRIRVKRSNPGNEVMRSFTPRCSSY